MKYLVVFVCTTFLFLNSAFAQSEMSAQALDARNKLESEIQKNLLNLISTKIDASSFTLGVRVQLTTIQPPKPENKKLENNNPLGMDLGAIDARELVASYERQIEEMKLKQDNFKKAEEKPNFQINGIDVVVGLDESYGEEYLKKFEPWLKERLKKDYGAIAKASANLVKIKSLPENTTMKTDDPESPKQVLKDWMPVFAAGLLAFALLMLGRTLKGGLTEVATAQKKLSVDQAGELTMGTKALPEPEEDVTQPGPGDGALVAADLQDFDRLTSKIAFVCMELGDKMNALVRVWVDSGDEGFSKTALLIDTIINAREKIMTRTGALAAIRIPLDEDLMQMREESLAEAYRAVSNMEEPEKIRLLEQIYWDLISYRTLGLQSLRRPFDYLQGMPKENILELLETQKEDARALAVIYLPEDTQANVLNEMTENKKIDLVKNMLVQSQISQKRIWDLDTSVKVATINTSSQPEEKLVNLFPRTIEILQTLSVSDEIKILRQVVEQLPDGGLVLKQQYSTLTFIDEWKPEYIRKLTQVATADEIVTLIKNIPTCTDVVLPECAPKIRMIVEDDLKLNSNQDAGATNTKLSGLRSKWNRIVVAENIPMVKVLIGKVQIGEANAA